MRTREQKDAESKAREELRNAVHSEMVRSGITRAVITKLVHDIVNQEIESVIKSVLKKPGSELEKVVEKVFSDKAPGFLTKENVKKAITEQIEVKAKEYINSTLKISLVENGGW